MTREEERTHNIGLGFVQVGLDEQIISYLQIPALVPADE